MFFVLVNMEMFRVCLCKNFDMFFRLHKLKMLFFYLNISLSNPNPLSNLHVH